MVDLDQVAVRAAVLKILLDRVQAAYDEAKHEAQAILGAQGRKNAVLDGNKIASVSITEHGRVSVFDEAALSKWVAERYPTEVVNRPVIRPAFLDAIKKASAEAGEPMTPDGTLDVPGINVGEPFASVRKMSGAAEIVEQLWTSGRLTIDGELKELTDKEAS